MAKPNLKALDEESEAAWKQLANEVDSLTLSWVASGIAYKRTHISRFEWLLDIPPVQMPHWEAACKEHSKLGPLALDVKSLEPWKMENTVLFRLRLVWVLTGGR